MHFTGEKIKKNKKPALILYHNHPGGNSFSKMDIGVLLTNPEIKEMIAVGHNGRVYSLKIGKRGKPSTEDFLKVYQNFFDKNNKQYGTTVTCKE